MIEVCLYRIKRNVLFDVAYQQSQGTYNYDVVEAHATALN